ncbi:MAG: WD40 repeat domain-containing protein [Deltaproteobacteria bacterium]|nr:WD40 repeat domain-containing protein [Candidatus Tharpella aukensis]
MTSLNTILSEQAAQITPQGTPILHSERVYCVAFSPDGRHIASGSVNRQVNFWEVGATELPSHMRGHTKFVWSLSFSSDGTTLASASGDGTVFLWDLEKRSHYRIEESHYATIIPLYGVAFSPQNDYFAAGCADGDVRLWSTTSKRPPWKLKGHKSEIYCVAFSPDGRFLASGSNDATVRIWNVENKCEEQVLSRPGCRVTSITFSPDGCLLAYASTNSHIYIVNLADGESQILSGHQGLVWSIAFSPDSRLLISGSNDHSVRLWDVENSQQIQILEGHLDDVNSVAFSPDGLLAASASDDRTVRIWDLSLLNERPETYLRLVAKQKEEQTLDKNLAKSDKIDSNNFLDPDKLAELILADSLPQAITDLYKQLLTLAPKLTFADHRGSQTYSCGGYHGLTHKGGLDNLALSEHLYPDNLLLHRILNHEALYYGREGEREKRRRITLIITQSGLEISGTANHLARALTLAAIGRLANLGGDLRHAFFGSIWTPPTDPLKPDNCKKILLRQDHEGLNLKEPFTLLKEQLRIWQENYHQIETLWIIDRHFAADRKRSDINKIIQEIHNLGRHRAWFINLNSNSAAPPPTTDLFHQQRQIVMQNDKITML